MEKAYIENKGITQTIMQDNHHHKKINEIKWDADYNGKYANIKIDVADDGQKNKYRLKLNNKDLANMLSVPSINMPIEQRLERDFLPKDGLQVDLSKLNMMMNQNPTPNQNIKSFIVPQMKHAPVEPEPIIVTPIDEPPYTGGGGGGGGGGSIYREYDTLDRQNLADGGMGRERIEFQ